MLVMVVTAVNDWKKEKQFRGLQEVIEDSKTYSVMRSGEVVEVSERSLVVGDVMILKYGDKIPADGILLRSSELRVDESVSISNLTRFVYISHIFLLSEHDWGKRSGEEVSGERSIGALQHQSDAGQW